MLPLKVTFEFGTPVVREDDHPIHFDGLLASCVAQEAEQFGSPTAWQDADDLSHLLERTDPDSTGAWVWKASQLIFEPASERLATNMVRRCEPEAFMRAQDSGLLAMRKPRSYLSAGSGSERSYFLLHSYQWIKSATAWCIGDPVEIKNALRFVQHLGKMSRNGFGMVTKIDVVVTEDTSDWMNRYLPASHTECAKFTYIPAIRRLQAPYWKKENMTDVKAPIH